MSNQKLVFETRYVFGKAVRVLVSGDITDPNTDLPFIDPDDIDFMCLEKASPRRSCNSARKKISPLNMYRTTIYR